MIKKEYKSKKIIILLSLTLFFYPVVGETLEPTTAPTASASVVTFECPLHFSLDSDRLSASGRKIDGKIASVCTDTDNPSCILRIISKPHKPFPKSFDPKLDSVTYIHKSIHLESFMLCVYILNSGKINAFIIDNKITDHCTLSNSYKDSNNEYFCREKNLATCILRCPSK